MYLLIVQQIERRTLADRQVAATLIAAGAKITLPDPDEARAAFDRALIEAPAAVEPERLVLMEALGVA